MITDQEILKAALLGLQSQIATIEAKMAEIRARLGGDLAPPAVEAPKKRTMSAAGRKAISEASKRRWAAQKKKA